MNANFGMFAAVLFMTVLVWLCSLCTSSGRRYRRVDQRTREGVDVLSNRLSEISKFVGSRKLALTEKMSTDHARDIDAITSTTAAMKGLEDLKGTDLDRWGDGMGKMAGLLGKSK